MKSTYKERHAKRLVEYKNSPTYKTVTAILERLEKKCPGISTSKSKPLSIKHSVTLHVSEEEYQLILMHRKMHNNNL